ncbi:GNAT family N-acetyltransferase [Streptomyces avicenniae]|uniref:GNAT family N-acetyltransferase n=1 Tax=Streptomyces avicenniae TaxID=500153 RepID=UPI000A9B4FB2|nr:GNAT family N-acetyltransferase [Streptomyces avicenniae]
MTRTAVVPLAEVYGLRWSVLRPGRPRESAVFAEDAAPGTFHVAAYDGEGPEVLACVSVFPDPFEGARDAYRFRGMASAPAARGLGFGAAVLEAAAAEAAARGADLLWCNGRMDAGGFYLRQGFGTVGDTFVVEGFGAHRVFTRATSPAGHAA